jgi:hypothetical protein
MSKTKQGIKKLLLKIEELHKEARVLAGDDDKSEEVAELRAEMKEQKELMAALKKKLDDDDDEEEEEEEED